MNSLISIIVPVYNVERFLQKCLSSLVSQTYKNIEIIIVNDGSPDNSQDIIDSYVKKFPLLIKSYSKPNGGISDARNFGLRKSSGEYVCFVDSDDWVENNMVEVSLKNISDNDILCFDYYNDTHNSQEELLESKATMLPNNFKNEKIMEIVGYAWNKLYKTDFLFESNLEFNKDLKIYEDIDFNLKCFTKTDKIKILNKPFYHYINRPSTSLIKNYNKNSIDYFNINQKTLNTFLKHHNFGKEMSNKIKASFINTFVRYQLYTLFNFTTKSFRERQDIIKDLLANVDNFELISNYKPNTNKDKIIKLLLEKRKAVLLNLLYSYKK